MAAEQHSPFHYAAFRHALIGRSISAAGSWMQTVAAGWLVYDITHNATAVGVLSVLSRGPGFLLSTYGGELADRVDRRRLAIVLYSIQTVAAAILAAFVWDKHGGLFLVYAATTIMGVAGALSGPAMQQVVTSTVPAELAKRATGLASVSFNLARLVGPALGGALVVAIGPGPCFAINAVSFLAVIVMLLTLPTLAGAVTHKKTKVRAAISEVRVSPLLRAMFTGAILFSVIVAPIQELAPAIAKRHGDGAHLLGFLLSALAAGGLIANLVRARLDKRGVPASRSVGFSMIACGVSLALLGAASSYAPAIGAMVLCGTAWDVIYVISLVDVQFEDNQASGLMTGLYFSATLGGVTLGAVLVGALFDAVGVSNGLALLAVGIALCGLHVLRAGERGRRAAASAAA
jgi:predicted MFS family arabinose efflux permease